MTTRKPVQIVEIDIDYCTRTFGSAPCTAALSADVPRKCFNTFATCADTANFDKGTLTLRFARNQTGLPKGEVVYPALSKVSTNPIAINLGGIDNRTGPLGKRARVTVDLLDFKDNDTETDKYQSGRVDGTAQFSATGYNPADLGTFFGKLRRRFPYYVGRSLRVLDGYEGEAFAAMRTRHYVISEWEGPDMAGRVKITAKDILDLAENEKALCPKPNTGKLPEDIEADGFPSFDLIPAGVGSEYATAGRASIGSEIVGFTRSGDTVQITDRAMDGSEAASHSENDLFQQCFRVEDETIADVAEDLLTTYAGVSASFIPSADWDSEAEWMAAFKMTATIAKPTGVTKLLGELAQHGVFWWWDEVAQEVKMRANRPLGLGETAFALADGTEIVEGSLSVKDLHKQRLTQILFWHGQLNAAESATDGENYARALGTGNNGGNANQHNQDRFHEIFSRWLGSGNDSVASTVAGRLAIRLKDTPRQVDFILDAKDRENVAPADLVTITTRAIQDEIGQSLPTEMQITSVEEHKPGHALKVSAVTHRFSGRYGFVTETSRPDYGASSDAQKAKGTYIVDHATLQFSDGTSPYVAF